jgi:chemotaxis protein CheD
MPALKQWVIAPPKKTLVVGVADLLVSNDPSADIVTYSLGSCLGISVYDPELKIGGLLHVMLPDSTIDANKAANSPLMFVDTGLPSLFHGVYALGADRGRLEVKAAGGAQFLDPGGLFNIGERNQQSLLAMLARNGVQLTRHDFGGVSSRTLKLDLHSGRIAVRCPGRECFYL